jgi:hypothetical protein
MVSGLFVHCLAMRIFRSIRSGLLPDARTDSASVMVMMSREAFLLLEFGQSGRAGDPCVALGGFPALSSHRAAVGT